MRQGCSLSTILINIVFVNFDKRMSRCQEARLMLGREKGKGIIGKGMKIRGKEVRRELEGRMKLFKVLVMSIIGYRLEI